MVIVDFYSFFFFFLSALKLCPINVFPCSFLFLYSCLKFVSCWHSFSYSEFPINMFMATAMFSWCVCVPVTMFFFPINMFYDCSMSCQYVFLLCFLWAILCQYVFLLFPSILFLDTFPTSVPFPVFWVLSCLGLFPVLKKINCVCACVCVLCLNALGHFLVCF